MFSYVVTCPLHLLILDPNLQECTRENRLRFMTSRRGRPFIQSFVCSSRMILSMGPLGSKLPAACRHMTLHTSAASQSPEVEEIKRARTRDGPESYGFAEIQIAYDHSPMPGPPRSNMLDERQYSVNTVSLSGLYHRARDRSNEAL